MSNCARILPIRFSVVMEMENATTVEWNDVGESLRSLATQIADVAAGAEPRPLVILAHPGQESESSLLIEGALSEAPRLKDVARLQAVSVHDGRYYELKNAGAALADGEVVVLLDADAVPEPGWLQNLLAPFEQPGALATNGHTYLGYSCLISKTLALTWVFPLRAGDARAERRALNANNCAFRTQWLQANPFPIDNGFKVSCTKQMKRLQQSGGEAVRAPAFVRHAPLSGWRFIVWRAIVTGRDADRKYRDLKSPSRARRFADALSFWWRMERNVFRQVLRHYHRVDLPVWQVPAALALGSAFYNVAFLSQIIWASGMTADRIERIPAYAEVH